MGRQGRCKRTKKPYAKLMAKDFLLFHVIYRSSGVCVELFAKLCVCGVADDRGDAVMVVVLVI